jgi:hypothetical protein
MIDKVNFSSMEPAEVTLLTFEQDGSITKTPVVRIPLRDEFDIEPVQE